MVGCATSSLPLYLGERTNLLASRAIPVCEGRSQPDLKVEFSENQII
ncbi:hypothetical protein E5S67_04811 [Microcoleus sp. IPMA8]|uniref:Uncharacterized protein n=1 Tax=Microcoleus asticus IPMA8 TaxID=2563858 RepID=A0ABX2D3I0_9CYAN|nr:hypothetical protein [Microcoleus asticus IPMA8]